MPRIETSPAPILFAQEDIETLRAAAAERRIPEDYVPEVLPYNGERLTVEVHKEHAYEVLDVLMEAFEANAHPYNQDRVRVPHDPRHMPETLKRGGVEHAMFLFNICYYMRGGIKSNDAVIRMSRVFDANPDLFDCDMIQTYQESDIEAILKDNGLGFQNTVPGQWIENAKRLLKRYGGDPRNIFDGVTTYEECLERVQNNDKGAGFLGFQEKMTSMIVYYLMDEELIGEFNFPIPIDLHVMRVSIANEMITFNGAPNGTNLFTDETLRALRRLYFDYAHERGVNPLRLCDAVWMLSESSCGRHPGNTTIEPLGREHRNGRSTYLIPKVVDINDPAQQKAYAASCGPCPIESSCMFNIPGTQYYVGGNVIIRGKRVRIPLPVERPFQGEQLDLYEH